MRIPLFVSLSMMFTCLQGNRQSQFHVHRVRAYSERYVGRFRADVRRSSGPKVGRTDAIHTVRRLSLTVYRHLIALLTSGFAPASGWKTAKTSSKHTPFRRIVHIATSRATRRRPFVSKVHDIRFTVAHHLGL